MRRVGSFEGTRATNDEKGFKFYANEWARRYMD